MNYNISYTPSFMENITLGEAEVLAVLGLIDVGMVGILVVAVDTPTGMDTVLDGVDAGGMYGICTRDNVRECNSEALFWSKTW